MASKQALKEGAFQARAAKRVGEGLAQRLYPDAVYRPEQAKIGGVDFTLPNKAALEAKCVALGSHISLSLDQWTQLQARGSRLCIAYYNRHLVAPSKCKGAEVWSDNNAVAQLIAKAIIAVLDIPAALLEDVAMLPVDSGFYIQVAPIMQVAARESPCGAILPRLDFRIGGARVRRDGLGLFVVGSSPYLRVESSRSRATPF